MRFIPPAILLAAAGWLASQWDALPARWVVHWGRGGVPDGYATKTFTGVFGPLLFGAGLAVFLEGMAVVVERTARGRMPRLARAYGNLVRWVSVAVAAIVSVFAIFLPSANPPPPRFYLGVCLVGIVLALVAGGWGLAVAARKMAAEGESLPKGYGPFFYSNPEDPRLLVPKLAGIGWTFNFARPAAWALLGLILLPAIVALVVAFVSAG